MKCCFLLIIFSVLVIACEVAPGSAGSDFLDHHNIDIAFVDTLTVKLATMKYDHLVTGGTQRVLAGTAVDGAFGTIRAIPCFALAKPPDAELEALRRPGIDFAGLKLVLTKDSYWYYDTTRSMGLKIHQLSQQLEREDGGFFHNNTKAYWKEEGLAAYSFTPKPNRRDTILIPMADSFGLTLFSKIQSAGDADFRTSEKFLSYLKGFAVVPDNALPGAILGFRAAVEMRLYYLDKNVAPAVKKFLRFNVNNSDYFTIFDCDYSDSQLTALRELKDRLGSELTQGEAFVQGGAGLAIRVTFPYARDLKSVSNFYVTRAILRLYPRRRSGRKFTPIEQSLLAYHVNRSNEIISDDVQSALLRDESDLGRDVFFEVDVTRFLQVQMNTLQSNDNALLICLPESLARTTVNRIIFSDGNIERKTSIKIFYARIKNQ